MRYVIRTVLISLGCFTVACLPARQVAAELPPEIMADKYLIHAEQLHAAKDYAGAFEVMEKIIALQKEHNLKLPDEFHFKYARVALSADSTRIALDSVSKYLSATGKEGKRGSSTTKRWRCCSRLKGMRLCLRRISTMTSSKLRERVTDCRKAPSVRWS